MHVETDRAAALAIERVLQCVAAAGIFSSVVVATAAIVASPIWRGAPGGGSPSRPPAGKPRTAWSPPSGG